MEECLVHLVPLRKLALPSDISDTEFGKFGGTTMQSGAQSSCDRAIIRDGLTFWLTWFYIRG